jgi:hypothetical protein
MMTTVLARFDAEMRRDPPRVPGNSIERCDGIVRCVGSYNMIISWQLAADSFARPKIWRLTSR